MTDHAEYVTLIFADIHASQQLEASGGGAHASKMARRQIVGAQGEGVIEEIIETDVAVTGQAGVGRDATGVASDEMIDDFLLEDMFNIDEVEGDAELGGDVTGFISRFQGAAAVFPAPVRGLLRPQSHHHPHHVVSGLDQPRSRHRAIDATTHGDDHGGLGRRFGGEQVELEVHGGLECRIAGYTFQ